MPASARSGRIYELISLGCSHSSNDGWLGYTRGLVERPLPDARRRPAGKTIRHVDNLPARASRNGERV